MKFFREDFQEESREDILAMWIDLQDRETADYLEATVYSKEEAVIMVGNFADVTTDEQRAKINHVTT